MMTIDAAASPSDGPTGMPCWRPSSRRNAGNSPSAMTPLRLQIPDSHDSAKAFMVAMVWARFASSPKFTDEISGFAEHSEPGKLTRACVS